MIGAIRDLLEQAVAAVAHGAAGVAYLLFLAAYGAVVVCALASPVIVVLVGLRFLGVL